MFEIVLHESSTLRSDGSANRKLYGPRIKRGGNPSRTQGRGVGIKPNIGSPVGQTIAEESFRSAIAEVTPAFNLNFHKPYSTSPESSFVSITVGSDVLDSFLLEQSLEFPS
jgi:hypothetical protein